MSKRRGRRDHQTPSSGSLTDPLSVLLTPAPVAYGPPLPLNQIEDRRTFHPDGDFRPVMSTNNLPINRVEVPPNVNKGRNGRARRVSQSGYPVSRVVFGDDGVGGKAVICARRQTRREVLLAKGKGGGGARRRPRKTPYSNIGC